MSQHTNNIRAAAFLHQSGYNCKAQCLESHHSLPVHSIIAVWSKQLSNCVSEHRNINSDCAIWVRELLLPHCDGRQIWICSVEAGMDEMSLRLQKRDLHRGGDTVAPIRMWPLHSNNYHAVDNSACHGQQNLITATCRYQSHLTLSTYAVMQDKFCTSMLCIVHQLDPLYLLITFTHWDLHIRADTRALFNRSCWIEWAC